MGVNQNKEKHFLLFRYPLLIVFCSRVVSSYGKTAEWPFGSRFGSPVGIPLDLRALAIVRRLAVPLRKRSVVFLLIGTGRWAAGRRGAPGPDPYLYLLSTCFPTSPNLIFINCHSHNLVTGTFYIVLWDWVLLVLRELRVPL